MDFGYFLVAPKHVIAAIFGFCVSRLFWDWMEYRQNKRYWKECLEASRMAQGPDKSI